MVLEPEKGRYGRNDSDSIKGKIVDENGLDVLYWRDLVGGARCNYCNCLYDQSIDPSLNKYDDRKAQESPLLSSNSERSSAYETVPSNVLQPQPPPKALAPQAPPPPPKASTPPPPPPPKAPPLPPPPMMKKNTAPPPPMPPRPPPSKNTNGAVPSPPPSSRSNGGSSGRPPLLPPPPDDGVRTRAKLKPLHWDKVNPPNADHSMVWDRISDGSFKIDDDLMDTLFGYKSSNQTNPNSTKTTSSNPNQIHLLDPRKSQNTAIIIRSLNITRQEIIDSLTQGKGLSPDTLEKLSKIALTKEEQSTILNFSNDITKLADAESFLFHLLNSVPSPFERVNAMLFKSTYDAEILHVKKCIQTLELACKEIKSHNLFLKLLEAILKAGNRMNAGTARGNAKAFNLSALCKLSDVKSTDGKTTLLHFVVEEVVRAEGKRLVINRNHSLRRSGSSSSSSNVSISNKTSREEKEKEYIKLGLPVVGGVSEELTNVKKAAAIDYDSLVSTCSLMGGRMRDIRVFLSGCKNNDGFVKEMKGFLEASEAELTMVIDEQMRVMEIVKRTTEYYQPGSLKEKNVPPLQLFVIVKDFFVMFDKVCVDITRNMQKKTVVNGGYSSARSKEEIESRLVARFPNLPPRFMSENPSKSSSGSESEDEF